ncbi:MAG TPA: SRPBCC family protein [Nocardioidaceae bacterium]|nr:SRPBCC family protein [Nocardioidaceae bacterium]
MTKREEQALADQLGLDRLVGEAEGLGRALADRGVSSVTKSIDSLTDRLNTAAIGDVGGKAMKATKGPVKQAKLKAGTELVKQTASAAGHGTTDQAKHGLSKMKDKVTGIFKRGSKGGKDKKLKVTNIVESVDVPVDRSTAYQLWTQFEDFPTFMKKVENVKQKSDAELEWKAQIFWSHRSWTAEIQEQVPDEKIVWRSKGEKGHVNGAVTFHELAPNLTRVLVTLEYHPQGLFEHTGNIWRAQGRRARLELKHYRRHVASHTLLDPEEVEGWTGVIHEGEVQSSSGGSSKSKSSGNGRSTRKKTAAKKSTAKKSTSQSSSNGQRNGSAKKSASRKKTAASRGTGRKTAQSSTGTAKKSTTRKRTSAKKS